MRRVYNNKNINIDGKRTVRDALWNYVMLLKKKKEAFDHFDDIT